MDFIIPLAAGQSVLVVQFEPGAAELKDASNYSEKLSSCIGSSEAVRVVGSSELDTISSSSYHVICVAGRVQLAQLDLPMVLRVLRPDGVLWMLQLVVPSAPGASSAAAGATSALTLAGFVKSHAEVCSTAENVNGISSSSEPPGDRSLDLLCRVHAYKPGYEVGASVSIKLPAKKEAATAWMLAASDMTDDFDVINSDTVLDADDLKKPDAASLRTCGVSDGSAKRKACKNCMCGLADQLDSQQQQPAQTSACGNCYLGDAFRCASCPYRGTPAFKPGEKVQLPVLSMQDDM